MITLAHIAALHDKWLNVAMKCGLQKCDAEEAVQNTYLYFSEQPSLDKYEWKDGKVNEAYVLFTVRSKAIDLQREQTRRKNSLVYESESPYDEEWLELQEERERVDLSIQRKLSDNYDCVQSVWKEMQEDAKKEDSKWRLSKLLFDILTDDERQYFIENKMNIAKLARESGISKDILYNERRKARKYFCEQCGDITTDLWPIS